jgi:hypothetical protein
MLFGIRSWGSSVFVWTCTLLDIKSLLFLNEPPTATSCFVLQVFPFATCEQADCKKKYDTLGMSLKVEKNALLLPRINGAAAVYDIVHDCYSNSVERPTLHSPMCREMVQALP